MLFKGKVSDDENLDYRYKCQNTIEKLSCNFIIYGMGKIIQKQSELSFKCTYTSDFIPKIGFGSSNFKQYIFVYYMTGKCSTDIKNIRYFMNEGDYMIVDADADIDYTGEHTRRICDKNSEGLSLFVFNDFSLYCIPIILCKQSEFLLIINNENRKYGIGISDLERVGKKSFLYTICLEKNQVGHKLYEYYENNNQYKLTEEEFMYIWNIIYPTKLSSESVSKINNYGF